MLGINPQTAAATGPPPPAPGRWPPPGRLPGAPGPPVPTLTKRSASGVLLDDLQGDPFPGPKAQVEGLQPQLLRGEGFAPGHRRLAGVQGGAILRHRRKIPPAPARP